jgi:predicted nucleic acid-binding Zn ribbon protein
MPRVLLTDITITGFINATVSGGLSTYKKTQKEEEKKLHMCYILIIIINNIIIITGFINATCQGGCLHIKKHKKKKKKKLHMCYILIIIIIIILIFFQCVLSVKVFGVNLCCEMDWEQMGCGG